ncbi:MAG: hypothetical protein MPK30_09515, partial [Gammaproteobacteria bacterium]|nr:hypothetical protein [Gammaproteobacteria bacterium]
WRSTFSATDCGMRRIRIGEGRNGGKYGGKIGVFPKNCTENCVKNGKHYISIYLYYNDYFVKSQKTAILQGKKFTNFLKKCLTSCRKNCKFLPP